MYVRYIWYGKVTTKVSTRAIVCEVGRSDKELATRAMIKLQFNSIYSKAKFIPFNKIFVPDDIMTNIIKTNNIYIYNTRKKIFEVYKINIKKKEPCATIQKFHYFPGLQEQLAQILQLSNCLNM